MVHEDFDIAAAEGEFLAKYVTGGRRTMYSYPKGPGWDDSPNTGHYDHGIISVHDGMLDAHIRTTDGVHRIAAFGPVLPNGLTNMYLNHPQIGNPRVAQLYGRYKVRFKVDSMKGYKGAWLLWPNSEVWPRDGEVDYPEGDFDSTMWAFAHVQGATSGGDQDYFHTGQTWTTWHVAVTEWTPTALRFYLDGALVGTSTRGIPNTPMRWTIQNETLWTGPEPADSVQGHIYIDYVSAWAYEP